MKRNSCLNLLKCIGCFCVVFIHVTFPGTLGIIIKYLSTFAVPVFMMISGYYSYGCDEKKIKQRLLKIVKIFIFGYLCFFAYNFAISLKNQNLIHWLSSNYNYMNPILFFCFCTVRWAIHLWYLIAMAETYFFWIIIVKRGLQEKICKCTYILFLIGAVITAFVETNGLNWSFKINFLCRALPWFLFGYIIKEKYEVKLKNINNLFLIFLAFIGWGITLSAILFKTKIDYSYFGVLITSPALFLVGIKNPDMKINHFITFIGDKLSLYIYILHPLVSKRILYIKDLFFITGGLYPYIHPVITVITSILISQIFYSVFKKQKLHKLLY